VMLRVYEAHLVASTECFNDHGFRYVRVEQTAPLPD
jgi:hypothetical protein